jgi:hypothetical protein
MRRAIVELATKRVAGLSGLVFLRAFDKSDMSYFSSCSARWKPPDNEHVQIEVGGTYKYGSYDGIETGFYLECLPWEPTPRWSSRPKILLADFLEACRNHAPAYVWADWAPGRSSLAEGSPSPKGRPSDRGQFSYGWLILSAYSSRREAGNYFIT